MEHSITVVSAALAGWLYGVVHTDLLRDSLALVSPVDPKLLTQLKDYYTHTRVGHGATWSLTFTAHIAALIITSVYVN